MKIVFLGDSITDVGRNLHNGSTADLGQGYVMLATGELSFRFPGKHSYINRAVSGSRIVDVYARIKTDCWNNEPDAVSILIGVNDVWHEFGSKNGVEPDRFEAVYDMLLSDTEKRFPNVKKLILEPFVLRGSATDANYDEFRARVEVTAGICRRLSEKHNAVFIPLQEKFDEAEKTCGAAYWLSDGVHPTPAGHMLIAKEWLAAFEHIDR